MPINPSFIGRSFPGKRPYSVCAEKIAEFATAIGDPHPVHLDADAARAAGYPDVIAPPTFPTVIDLTVGGPGLLRQDGLGIDLLRVVHGEQRFVYTRPIHAGDVITLTTTFSELTEQRGNEYLTLVTEFVTTNGELVCTGYNTVVSRGTAASDAKAEAQ